METKTCNVCRETKPFSEFYFHRGRPENPCKPCFNKRNKTYQMRPPRHQTPPGTKRCTICKETKPEDQFHLNKSFHDGKNRICKPCALELRREYGRKNQKTLNAKQMERYYKDPLRYMEYERKKRYGMPPGEYARMLAAQDGRCAICGTDDPAPRKHFAVDHCQDTGAVRGLLCSNCNTGIGQLQHNRDIILSAIKYLQQYQPHPNAPVFDADDSILQPNC